MEKKGEKDRDDEEEQGGRGLKKKTKKRSRIFPNRELLKEAQLGKEITSWSFKYTETRKERRGKKKEQRKG